MINGQNTTASTVNYITQNERLLSDALSSSDMVAITSAFIALLALFATIYSSLLQRKHNRLSSKPAVNMAIDARRKSMYLSNHGLGPAFLKEVEGVFNGRIYNLLDENDSDAFSDDLCAEIDLETRYGWMILEKDEAIAAGAEQMMLTVYSDEEKEWDAIDDALGRCSIKVVYESVYREKGVVTHVGNSLKEKTSGGTNS